MSERPADRAYRVLARKYRPRNFDDLIGQEPMVRTLKNAFETGRIAQAWMLTGVRGVGKTTTARILARALNYKTAEIDRPMIELKETGEHCEAIMEGRHVDVVEMDAASHTGIDDIRDIIEQVRYRPVSARYKVYIIDEVHMLSNQAFNGLLKTLEEPPPHVKFVFATTEIRKVPITVLSRCQRFDLRRVDGGVLAAHLKRIAGLEQIEAEDAAIAMIARAAEGSVRDSLSILDQAIAHGSGHVAAEGVRSMLGLADRARIIDLFEMLMRGDIAGALKEFRSQYDAGADPPVVMAELADFNHLVTRLRFTPEIAEDLFLAEEDRTRGAAFASSLSLRVLSRTWQMLLKGIGEVESANRPVQAAEMLLIRIAHAADLPSLDEALKSLQEGSVATATGRSTPNQQNATAPAPGAEAMRMQEPAAMQVRSAPDRGAPMAALRPAPDREPATRPAAPEPAPRVVISGLQDIAALADQHRDIAFKVALKQNVRLVRLEPGRLDVALRDEAPRSLLNDLSQKLAAWTGGRWMVSLSREEGGPTLAEEEAARRDLLVTDARADPDVAAILAQFPGARIIDVRIAEPAAGTAGTGGGMTDSGDDIAAAGEDEE